MPLSAADHAIRSTGIGSSDIAAISGLNPWRTAHDVWLDKRGLVERKPEELSTKIGHLVEGLIAELYTDQTGLTLETSGTLRHPEHSWMVATPDRIASDRLVEIKWVGWRVASTWESDSDGVPDYVRCQAEWLMDVYGIDRCDVAAILGGDEFRIYELRKSDTLIGRLREAGKRFWSDHVLAGVPPRVDESDGAKRMLRALYRSANEDIRADDGQALGLVLDKLAADGQEKEAKARGQLAGNLLRELIAESSGIAGHWGRVTWKPDTNGRRNLRVSMRKDYK